MNEKRQGILLLLLLVKSDATYENGEKKKLRTEGGGFK